MIELKRNCVAASEREQRCILKILNPVTSVFYLGFSHSKTNEIQQFKCFEFSFQYETLYIVFIRPITNFPIVYLFIRTQN